MSAAWKPRGISFSSGGVRVIGHLGVLARLVEEGVTSDVTDWYGCSGGCLTAYLGALGASAAWLRDVAEHFDMSCLVVPDPLKLAAFTEHWGVCDGKALLDFYCRMVDIWAPGSSQWTFADLARERPGARISILSTNVTRGLPELFNLERTPTARIILDALRASMAVPLFFTPSVNTAGEYLCDGAVTEYYVWNSVRDKENTMVIGCDDSSIMGRTLTPEKITSVGEYVSRVFTIGHSYKTVPMPRYWIAINDDQSFLNFQITREGRLSLFEDGRRAADRWLAFRRQAAAGGTDGTRPVCEGRNTLSSEHPSPDKTSGNRQSQTLPQPPSPSRGSPREGRLPGRRWSL